MNASTDSLLRPDQRQRLASFVFRPRGAVEGLLAGRHASRRSQSSGIEFLDTRPYMPGDEIADIDWKAYGRTDRLYVRQFERETDMTVACLIDASASMAYGRAAGPSKLQHACCLAAAVSTVVASQQDRVALGVAREGLDLWIPPSTAPSQPKVIGQQLAGIQAAGQTRLGDSVRQVLTQIRAPMVLVLFSDLLCETETLVRPLDQVGASGEQFEAELVVRLRGAPNELG
ncbi:MAG: DUF58 domain-containing protein, partial [Phycisphaeraceae bacterium]|nr:DUF58 domain-containing protein [Phycisphaeraceae bacterium]